VQAPVPPPTSPPAGGRLNLYDQQAANRRGSWLLAIAVVGLLAGLGYAVGWLFDPALAGLLMLVAALVGVAQSAAAYWFSDRIALAVTGARPANEREHRYLQNITEAVAIGAGVPMPRLYVIDDPSPNAFATGRDPEHGTIAVTTGLLERLGREELEGVVAHEMAHIKNYDIRLASMLVATVGAIVLLRDVALRSLRFGGRGPVRRSSSKGAAGPQALLMVVLLILVVLAPLLATLLRFAVSRQREYLADATAALLTRNPEGLARALERLRDDTAPPMRVSEGVRHLFFNDPNFRAAASGLTATHPPIAERIARLRRM
jgi:heat shock protein HtpX